MKVYESNGRIQHKVKYANDSNNNNNKKKPP